MTSPNQPQIDFWNGPAAARWVREQERLDRAFTPLDEFALARLGVAPGERVVDVGCGCGASTLALAERVGSSGHVLGVDVSAPMLARAKERALSVPWVELALADASSYRFTGDRDLVFSRFGSMFFVEPVAAFTNLRTALKPGGRLGLVCWRVCEDNPWFSLPVAAAATVTEPPAPGEPDAPGPFAFASEVRLRDVLARAGFHDVVTERHDAELVVSAPGRAAGLDEIVDFAMQVGPVARMLLDADTETVRRVREAIANALASDPRGPAGAMVASVWLATARAS